MQFLHQHELHLYALDGQTPRMCAVCMFWHAPVYHMSLRSRPSAFVRCSMRPSHVIKFLL